MNESGLNHCHIAEDFYLSNTNNESELYLLKLKIKVTANKSLFTIKLTLFTVYSQ